MLPFLKREPKEKLNCLGIFDTKPYHYFESNFIYAKDILIKKMEGIKVFARVYINTVLVFVLVENESIFNPDDYTIHTLKEELQSKLEEEFNNSVVLVIYKHNNDKVLELAKRSVENTKTDFYQALVYNDKKVRLEYYRPIPKFYKLYSHYLEAIYMDIAATDPTR